MIINPQKIDEVNENYQIKTLIQGQKTSIQNQFVFDKFKAVQKLVCKLTKFFNKKVLILGFQPIYHYSSSLKNKQLIYEAIYKKNSQKKNQSKNTKNKKQNIILSTLKKQKQQEFSLYLNDISTIDIEKQQKQTLSKDSRIELQKILQSNIIQSNNFVSSLSNKHNKFIFHSNQQITNQFPYFLSKKKSRTDKNINQQIINDSLELKNNQKNKNNSFLKFNQTIRISCKKTKQTSKSTHHQIYIFREPSIQRNRALSQDRCDKIKFIQLPLKSKNIKVIECSLKQKRDNQTSQSTNSKKCLNTSASGNEKLHQEQCKYCTRIQKSRSMIKNLRKLY